MNGIAAGEFGTVYRTWDGGKEWKKQASGVENVFFSCKILDKENLWLAGIDSLVLHSLDGGKKWERVDTGVKKLLPIYEIDFRDQRSGIVCGQGFLLYTEDGGMIWKQSSVGSSLKYIWLYDVAYSGSATTWLVGEKGKIFQSLDKGKAWQEITYE